MAQETEGLSPESELSPQESTQGKEGTDSHRLCSNLHTRPVTHTHTHIHANRHKWTHTHRNTETQRGTNRLMLIFLKMTKKI